SAVFSPDSCSLIIAMICSSVNRAFICPSFCWADSTQIWRNLRGAGQLDEMVLKLGLSLTPQQRGDLTIELYKLESENDLEADLDLRKYEGMLRSFR
ncbi:MAG: hypothetical protein ABJQ70_00765, partial [Roseobacter sp.]